MASRCLKIVPFVMIAIVSPGGAIPADAELPAAESRLTAQEMDHRAAALRQLVQAAARRGDTRAVLEGMDEYHQLHVISPPDPLAGEVLPPGLRRPEIPASLWFTEARAAFEAGDAIRAAAALHAFLDMANAMTPGRDEALALRASYERAAEQARLGRASAALAAKPELVQAILLQMVDIPAGSLRMGDPEAVLQHDHQPAFHVETLRAFRLSRYEVTFAQYDQYADATGHERPRKVPVGASWQFADEFTGGRDQRPVTNVSWKDAQGFIAWLNQGTGRRFRLPREAEWEYAARAGSRSTYPWGDRFDTHLANGNGRGAGDSWYFTAPVGSFPPNAWDLFDMIGNVAEWMQDCIDGSRGAAAAECHHVIRGGGWSSPPGMLAASYRGQGNMSEGGESNLGFRLAEDR